MSRSLGWFIMGIVLIWAIIFANLPPVPAPPLEWKRATGSEVVNIPLDGFDAYPITPGVMLCKVASDTTKVECIVPPPGSYLLIPKRTDS